MDQNQRNMLRQLPSMDEVLSLPEISIFEKTLGRKAVKSVVADVIGDVRKSILVEETGSVSLENIQPKSREDLQNIPARAWTGLSMPRAWLSTRTSDVPASPLKLLKP
jgi:hypothetical protein